MSAKATSLVKVTCNSSRRLSRKSYGALGERVFVHFLLCTVDHVWSVLLSESEAWTMNKQMEKKIEAFEVWCWRRLLKIS